MNVQYIVCFDDSQYFLFLNYFNYSKTSDFVGHLKSIPDQRKWFYWSWRKWNNDWHTKFAETLTTNGIGFTFNIVSDSELLKINQTSNDFRYSYNDKDLRQARPWSTEAQQGNGLTMKLYYWYLQKWDRSTCRYISFAVHSPYELPLNIPLTQFDYGRDLNVWITPEIIQTDEGLRKFDPDHRKCYFDNERQLKYFNVYTRKNCEMECLSFIGE